MKRNNITYSLGGLASGRTPKQLGKISTQQNQLPVIPKNLFFSYCGASKISEINEDLFNELITQFKKQAKSKETEYKTNELFDTKDYYGYIAYPYSFGELQSLRQNGGEEQLSAWINMGTLEIDSILFVFYRTSIPKAYQTNQLLVCF